MRKALWFSLVLIAVASVTSVSVTNAQGIGDRNRPSEGGNHIISGRVYLPNGKPAVGVRVSMSSTDIVGSWTTTDTDGIFTFSGLPGGNYTITVRAEGYQTENETMTIERFAASGQGYRLVFNLRLPGQPKTSSRAANPLLKDVPKDAAAKYEKGMAKASKNELQGAVADFDSAIAAYPNFAAAYYEKGAALLKTNEADKAIEAFVKAISIKPDYLEAKYGYGLAQFEKKNYEVAAAAFNDVLQQRKDMAEAHLNLGVSLFYLKNTDAAEAELRTAITARGGEKLALAHLYLGQIYAQKKRNTEAVTELEKYLELVPKAPNAERIRTAIADLKKRS